MKKELESFSKEAGDAVSIEDESLTPVQEVQSLWLGLQFSLPVVLGGLLLFQRTLVLDIPISILMVVLSLGSAVCLEKTTKESLKLSPTASACVAHGVFFLGLVSLVLLDALIRLFVLDLGWIEPGPFYRACIDVTRQLIYSVLLAGPCIAAGKFWMDAYERRLSRSAWSTSIPGAMQGVAICFLQCVVYFGAVAAMTGVIQGLSILVFLVTQRHFLQLNEKQEIRIQISERL